MHDNLLKLYTDKEKATTDNMTTWCCKILTRKVERLNAIKPDSTFGLDYIIRQEPDTHTQERFGAPNQEAEALSQCNSIILHTLRYLTFMFITST